MPPEATSGLLSLKPKAGKPAPEKSEDEKGEYPEITPPPDYSPPDDAAEGDTFDATVKFKVKGGKLCILSIDGVPYTEEEQEEEPAKSPSLAEAAAAQRMEPGYGAM